VDLSDNGPRQARSTSVSPSVNIGSVTASQGWGVGSLHIAEGDCVGCGDMSFRVSVLEGGLPAWRASGGEVDTSAVQEAAKVGHCHGHPLFFRCLKCE
jgi:hypothetical protein